MRLNAFGKLICFLAVFSSVLIDNVCIAQDRQKIEAGKKASALVELPKNAGFATAFCIKSSGVFVTNRHVVQGMKLGDQVTLILDPSLETQRVVESKIVRVDTETDLAILRSVSPDTFETLKIASSQDLYETMNVTAFGFPFGAMLSLSKGSYPSISINSGRITSLRKTKGEIQLLQLDAVLNPGNSGGPIINEAGEVIGITSFGLKNAGVNFAVPSDKLRALIVEPSVQVNVSDLTSAPVPFPKLVEARVLPFEGELLEPTVEFELSRENEPPLIVPMVSKGKDRYEAVVDAKALGRESSGWLTGKIEFTQGSIQGQIANDKIATKQGPVALSELSSIQIEDSQNLDTVLIILRNGQTRVVEKASLPKVKVELGNYPATVMLSRAVSLQLDEQATEELHFSIVVKSQGKEIYRKSEDHIERIDADIVTDKAMNEVAKLESHAPSTTIPKFQDRRLLRSKQSLKMPSAVTDVHLAGGGRYFVVFAADAKQLIVIDLMRGEKHGDVKLRTKQVLVTATKNHIIVVDQAAKTIERIALDSLKRETMVKTDLKGTIKGIVAGYDSDGPLLVSVENEPGTVPKNYLACVNLKDLHYMKMETVNPDQFKLATAEHALEMRSSADGKVFGLWSPSQYPEGTQSVILENNKMIFAYQPDTPGYVVPSADGSVLNTGRLGPLNVDLRPTMVKRGASASLVPSTHPRISLMLKMMGEKSETERVVVQVGIPPSDKPILELKDVAMPPFRFEPRNEQKRELPLDKRIFYWVEQSLIVTIPASNDRVTWEACNLLTEFKTRNLGYFFVSSSAPKIFVCGKTFEYQLKVQSNSESLNYTLISGPPDMKISSTGLIRWNVPKNGMYEKVNVVVSIQNQANEQIFEMFTLQRYQP